MKYKKILEFFLVALPLSVLLRTVQLIFTIEPQTGFFKPESGNYGFYMLMVIIAFSLLAAIFGFTAHRSPGQTPKPNIFMSIGSLGLALGIFYEANIEELPQTVMLWQRSLLFVTAVLAGVYFIVFALKRFVTFSVPPICAALPVVYMIFRVICYFSAISPLALISDNVILMAAYLASLWFMLQFAKLYNDVGSEKDFRKLLASGLISSILCFTQSIPHFIMNFINGFEYQHTSIESNITVLFMGIFILSFTLSHFSRKNSCE